MTKEIAVNLIEKTKNPVAPVAFYNLSRYIEIAAKILAPISELERANHYTEKLMSNWTDEEFKKISSDPNFALALLAMTREAVIDFAKKP